MTLQKTLLKTFKKSKLLKMREAQLLELHRGKLVGTVLRYAERNSPAGDVYSLFERSHPGHYNEFRALLSESCDLSQFRYSQVKIYRTFVERLIK